MKKRLTAILCLILPAFILIAGAENLGGSLEAPEDTIASDPFAAMYDADVLALERLEPILRDYEREPAPGGAEERRGPVSEVPMSPSEQAGEVRALLESGHAEQLGALPLPDELAEQAERVIQDTYEDRYIVKYKPGENGTISALSDAQSSPLEGSEGLELVTLPERTNPIKLAQALQEEGAAARIEYIQPDVQIYPAALSLSLTGDEPPAEEPNPSQKPSVEPSPAVEPSSGADSSPEKPETSPEPSPEPSPSPSAEPSETPELSDVIVAIMDTGVDILHPMLSDRLWTSPDGLHGWNFHDDNDELYNPDYPTQAAHGTHVAGIIAQNTGENVKLMILPAFGPDGARTSDILDALDYAVANGASVINCSFGSSALNPALEEAMRHTDALIVSAAGNGRSDLAVSPVYPAAYRLPNLLSVGSVNDDGGFSYFSNYSETVLDITAPGRAIVSALPDGEEGPMTGTSMSAAHVSAGAAEVLSVNPELSPEALQDKLLNAADRLDNLENKAVEGRRLNVGNALAGINGENLSLNPLDDFDVHGYSPTAEESWELYSEAGKAIQVSAGAAHSLALKEDGTVWAWGSNEYGQLGNGNYDSSSSPVQVIGLTDIVEVSAGGTHSLALASDGTAWAWGDNTYGQLGIGPDPDPYESCEPQQSQIFNAFSVVAGVGYSLAISEGGVYAFGDNYGCHLVEEVSELFYPTQISGLIDITAIATGGSNHFTTGFAHAALTSQGSVYKWGLGEPLSMVFEASETDYYTSVGISSYPLDYLGIENDGSLWHENAGLVAVNVASVSSGAAHNLMIDTDGAVYAWGDNAWGKLGNGTNEDSSSPVPCIGLPWVASVDAGEGHSLAIDGTGEVWAWGDNSSGQLGNGTTDGSNVPLRIGFLGNAIPSAELSLEAAAGSEYTVSLTASEIESFAGQTYTLSYDPAKLQLLDFAAQTAQSSVAAGQVAGTLLTILSHENGELEFTVTKDIPQGKVWSGVITVLKFEAVGEGGTTVAVG